MQSVFDFPRTFEDDAVSQELRDNIALKLLEKYGDDSTERIITVLKYAGKKISSAIKKDLSNRYSLDEDWLLPPVKVSLPSYDDGWIAIEPLSNGTSMILIYAYKSDAKNDHCDGVTFGPDRIKGGIPGALFHDIWYERMESIAKVWGWKVSKVRKLGDQIFASIMMEEGGNKFVINTAYGFVRVFGGVFHSLMKIKWLKKIITAIIFSVLIFSVSGCVTNIFDTTGIEYEPPVWTHEKN